MVGDVYLGKCEAQPQRSEWKEHRFLLLVNFMVDLLFLSDYNTGDDDVLEMLLTFFFPPASSSLSSSQKMQTLDLKCKFIVLRFPGHHCLWEHILPIVGGRALKRAGCWRRQPAFPGGPMARLGCMPASGALSLNFLSSSQASAATGV